MGINFKRHLETAKDDKLIISKGNGEFATSYYFPESYKTIIKINKDIVDSADSLLLIHKLGHAYFNQYYNYDFYNKSNLLLSEVLAHFTQILFGMTLLKSNLISEEEKQSYRFHYLYRLHQCVFSLFVSHFKKNEYINTKDFLNLRKKENDLMPNIALKNADYSKLNILIYEPFATGIFHMILDSLAFSLAIFLYEKFSKNLDLLFIN